MVLFKQKCEKVKEPKRFLFITEVKVMVKFRRRYSVN